MVKDAKHLLESIIEDMKDDISDYTHTIDHPKTRLEPYEYRIRRDELRSWKKYFEVILSELED